MPEMAIFAAPLEIIMAEGQDMYSIAFHVVKTMLLLVVIRVTIILSSGARIFC